MTQKTFTDLGLINPFVEALDDQGIVHPFPIQELAIPMALKGADVIGQARTGTGKTFAFGLPLLQRIDPDRDQTQALVITPTRELCIQVASDLEIGKELGVRIQTVYGGVGYDEQIEALTTGVHVVVGTPGRTLDHLGRGNLDLSNVTELVLDEADEMLDMGFLPDVERLIEGCPEDRHTMLFSATMQTEIVKLARRYMSHPTFLRADVEEHEVAPTVEQHFFLVHRMDKPRILARILQSPDRGGAYVFTRTKRMADRLVQELDDLGVSAIAIHGDKRQATREKNMDEFRDGNADVLVATEVAARGLDVENVTHVVNYDCPDDEKMYLHRIGRTARAGAAGVAITFGEFNEVDRVNMIRKAVEADQEIEEVFSTSDLLTERFDLPDTTPWEHLGSDRSSSKKPSKKSSRRKSQSDGRPKSSRKDEGSGGEHRSAKRDRSRQRDHDRSRPAPVKVTDEKPAVVRTRERTVQDTVEEPKKTRTRARRSKPAAKTSQQKTSREDKRSDDKRSQESSDVFVRTTAEPVVRTTRGQQARGTGTPQLTRRVKVEHLP